MASISRRENRGNRWQARYRDNTGREHAKLFDRKVDAERWIREHAGAVDRGTWINPNDAKRSLKDVAEAWRVAQEHRDTTRAMVETHLRRHVYPTFGERPIGSIRTTEVQAWVTRSTDTLAPATVRVIYSYLAAIMTSAVRDRLIPASPCIKIKLPTVEPSRVVPMPTELLRLLETEIADRYRALIILAAGTGIRQGEAFGLTVDRVDFLRRTLTVDRQLVTMPKRAPYLAPPKTKASSRVIPLPQVVVDVLAAHLASYPAGPGGFVFTTEDGQPIRRTAFSYSTWRPAAHAALKKHAAELEKARKVAIAAGNQPNNLAALERITFHDLRHYYASLLIRHSESIKTVQARLGHASAAETLDTYSHLWPDSDDRTREAVDSVLASPLAVAR